MTVRRTVVHLVTPHAVDGKAQPLPNGVPENGTCHVGSPILGTSAYLCRTSGPLGHGFSCQSGCELAACWRDARLGGDEMICLLSPFIATDPPNQRNDDEVVIRLTNSPGQAKPNPRPERSRPWAFEFSDGHTCQAVGKIYNGQLNYFCDGPNRPATNINRSKPIWTVKTAPTISDANAGIYPDTARIVAVWFGGNSQ